MKTKKSLLIVGLVVLSVMVVFTTPVMATDLFETNVPEIEDDPIKFDGTITLEDGPWANKQVVIAKKFGSNFYAYSGSYATSNSAGEYETGWSYFSPNGHFGMFVRPDSSSSWELLEEKDLTEEVFTELRRNCWEYTWDYGIPEFSTIALPVASVLGLLFFFNHRKRRKE